MSMVKIAPAGDNALLVELGDVTASELHRAATGVRRVEGVVACIAGRTSLYVVFDGRARADGLREAIVAGSPVVERRRPGRRITVSFHEREGIDLPDFLAFVRVSRDEFLERVSRLHLLARFIGFRGGFAYLDGWPAEWAMPRRPTSRMRVARGTFALGGAVAGFYPIDSPGGWNLLGRTAEDLECNISAGDEIAIEPTLEPLPDMVAARVSPPVHSSIIPLRLVAPSLSRVVAATDWSGIDRGISPGGPFDLEAAAHANRAVGNEADHPVLECALAGPRAIAEKDVICSWFGSEVEIQVAGRVVENAQFEVRAGAEVTVGRITGGMRGYLAVGSRRGTVERLERSERLTVRTIAGPHDTPLRKIECEVTSQLDRVGIRMRPLEPSPFAPPADLPSCGMQFGTIQLHPDGSFVAMGPDHPVTGGYLQPMTVISSERWKLAQLVPGDRVRFVAQSISP